MLNLSSWNCLDHFRNMAKWTKRGTGHYIEKRSYLNKGWEEFLLPKRRERRLLRSSLHNSLNLTWLHLPPSCPPPPAASVYGHCTLVCFGEIRESDALSTGEWHGAVCRGNYRITAVITAVTVKYWKLTALSRGAVLTVYRGNGNENDGIMITGCCSKWS